MNTSIDQTYVPKYFSFMYSGINKEIPMQTINEIGKYCRFVSITRLAKELDIKDDLMEFFETENGKICIEAIRNNELKNYNIYGNDNGGCDGEDEEGKEGEGEGEEGLPYMLIVNDESVHEANHGVYVHPLIFEAIILWKGRKRDYISSLLYLCDW